MATRQRKITLPKLSPTANKRPPKPSKRTSGNCNELSTAMPRRPRSPNSAERQAFLVLMIHQTPYLLTRLQPNPNIAKHAWQLRNHRTTYEIFVDEFGWHCNCPSGYARENDGIKCKHVQALKSVLKL